MNHKTQYTIRSESELGQSTYQTKFIAKTKLSMLKYLPLMKIRRYQAINNVLNSKLSFNE